MDKIKEYFPDFTATQYEQLEVLGELYIEWNAKVNLVSRKDIEHIFDRHILHAISIHHIMRFKAGSKILDLGTGGGLPGLPLAILFPESDFHLIDARSKKIMVVQDIVDRLSLSNVRATHGRAEELKSTYDFIVSRAVAQTKQLIEWTGNRFSSTEINAIPNGYILLKGGDVRKELKEAKVDRIADVYPIIDFIQEPWYEEKKLIYIPA